MLTDLSFLTSRRFWAVVIVAIINAWSIFPPEVTNALTSILLGFVGIRTIDRFSEKWGK